VQPGCNCGVNNGVIVGKQIEGGSEVFSEPTAVRNRVRKDSPDKSDKCPSSDSSQPIGSKFEDRVVWLTGSYVPLESANVNLE
jgi:hypothetical protein